MSHLSCHLFVAKYALYTWTNVVDRLIYYVQGYAAVQGKVGEVEVWGLGGSDADEQQAKFQHRENLFAEQRRKVDLKSFGNWQDSPEAAMMDMVSNPQKATREERWSWS